MCISIVHRSSSQSLANSQACFVCMSLQVIQVTDGETTVPWLLSWQEWPLASITFTGYASPTVILKMCLLSRTLFPTFLCFTVTVVTVNLCYIIRASSSPIPWHTFSFRKKPSGRHSPFFMYYRHTILHVGTKGCVGLRGRPRFSATVHPHCSLGVCGLNYCIL